MRAKKAIWLRPACGYVDAAVCVAIATWGASRPLPTLGFVQARNRADRDTQLPLERFRSRQAMRLLRRLSRSPDLTLNLSRQRNLRSRINASIPPQTSGREEDRRLKERDVTRPSTPTANTPITGGIP
ncbi:hypothetical protein [Paraburkholderia sp. RL17-373-BIF-A]|uniref:hypothetical protein n=1 Tax=Paraburkholderia sp. RL17-373-BIF-A TaxID=3031629 RepID=UPI0038BB7001